ncbi:MAG: OmpL47-type beta-barrel domain-containing protein, partial [Thermoplasmatota archaeon]
AVSVDRVMYRVDQGDWHRYTGGFTVPEGKHTVYYYAVDILGNIGDLYSVMVDVGGGMPSSSCYIIPDEPTGDNGWYISSVSVALSAFDEVSGVSHIMYRVDDGVWLMYYGSFDVDTDGQHVIEYYADDNAGNREPVNAREVKIDLYGPEITISRPYGHLYLFDRVILPLPGNRTVVVGQVTVAATVVDTATSGVAAAELYIDDKLRDSFERDLTYTLDELMLGRCTIRVVAYDNAGNKAVREVTVSIFNLAIESIGNAEDS